MSYVRKHDVNYLTHIDRCVRDFINREGITLTEINGTGRYPRLKGIRHNTFQSISYKTKRKLGKDRYKRTRSKWAKMYSEFTESHKAEYFQHQGELQEDKVIKENGVLVA